MAKTNTKLTFKLHGIELMQKEVKSVGSTAHIYLPKKYIGKKVYIVIP